jgi:hypothetical protein
MYTYLSGDVEITGPSTNPAENMAMQVVDEISDQMDPLLIDVVYVGQVLVILDLGNRQAKWDAYGLLSERGYDVKISPGTCIRVLHREYVTI